MPVNNVVVRLRADIADYSAKLTEAQRMMATRIANIRANMQQEVAIARQAFKEKEKLAEMGVQTDVAAARRSFQQRVELARATAAEEIKQARRSHAEVSAGLVGVGESASKAHGGLGKMSSALLTVVRQMTGMPPAVAQVGNALGGFAIGAAPMLAILAGLAAVAWAFNKITKEARETAKAAKEAAERIAEAWAAQQTAGDQPLISDLSAVGKQRDAVAAKLQRLRAAPDLTLGGPARLEKLLKEEADLKEQYDHADAMLTERRTERQKDAADKIAAANTKAAADVATAWKKAITEIVALAEQHAAEGELADLFAASNPLGGDRRNATQVRFDEARGNAGPASEWLVTGGKSGSPFDILTVATASTAASMKKLKEQADEAATAFGKIMIGPDGQPLHITPSGDGLFGPLKDRLLGSKGDDGKRAGGLLDPKAILNNALGGLASGGISMALGFVSSQVGKFVGGLFDHGKTARIAAEKMREAQAQFTLSLELLRASVAGNSTDLIKALAGVADEFKRLRDEADHAYSGRDNERERALAQAELNRLEQQRIAQVRAEFALKQQMAGEDLEVRLLRAQGKDKEADALERENRQARELRNAQLEGMDAEYIARLEAIHGLEDLAKTTSTLSDAMRNIPAGFKIASAVFNSTRAGATSVTPTTSGDPLTIRIVTDPEGIFKTVEVQAVKKIRKGGKLAWELA